MTNTEFKCKIKLIIQKRGKIICMKKYICSLFKKIYIALKSTDEQKALFKKLQKGDMVWAKMPLSNKELEKIEEKHRIRPYLKENF